MQTNEYYNGAGDKLEEATTIELPDHVVAMVLSMLTKSDLLKAMVLTFSFTTPFSHFSRLFVRGGCSS